MSYKDLVKQEIAAQLRSTGLSEPRIRQLTSLYVYNTFRKAEALARRLPSLNVGATAYGLLTKETYLNINLKQDVQKQLDLNRTDAIAREFDKGFEKNINGKNVYIKSPAELNREYAVGQISRDEWLKGLDTFKNLNEDYLFRAYE